MVHTAVHIASGNQEGQPGSAQNPDTFFILPVGLGYDAHRVTMGLQHPADDGMPERRVVHIGISDHIDEIQLLYSPVFHVLPADW